MPQNEDTQLFLLEKIKLAYKRLFQSLERISKLEDRMKELEMENKKLRALEKGKEGTNN